MQGSVGLLGSVQRDTGAVNLEDNVLGTTFSRRKFLVMSGASSLVPLAGCQPPNPKKLKAGYVKVLAGFPFMFALDAGLFRDVGLDIDVSEFANSNDVSLAAVSGSIDFVGAGATNASLDAMTAANTVLQMFTSNDYVKRPDRQSTDFLLSLPGYDTIESLKGKTIGFFPGSFGRMFARLVLPQLGLSLDEVNYVEMQPPQWLAALRSGSIQAVTALEPVATQILETMNVNVLVDGYYATVMQNVPASGSWFRQGHLDSQTEEAVHGAMKKAIEIISTDRAAATDAIARLFGLAPEIASKVRLLDWHSVREPAARQSLIDFGQLLERENGISRPPPPNHAWLWT